MGVVYLAYNKINGKSYIGKTIKSLLFRKQEHIKYAKDNRPFHNAIKKYGENAFIWRVLFKSNDEKELNKMEIRFIKKLNTKIPNGYNLAKGGQGVSGVAISESVKQILREKANEQFNDPIKKAKHKLAMQKWGEELSLEMREILGNNGKLNKGISKPNDFGGKVSAGLKRYFKNHKNHRLGCTDSEVTRKKKSDAAKNKPPVKNSTKEKLRKINLGKTRSEESKNKNRIIAINQWKERKLKLII